MAKPSYAVAQTAVNKVKLETLNQFPDWSPRYELGDMKALEASIKAVGIQVPLYVDKSPDGKIRILNGLRRYHCAVSLASQGIDLLIPVQLAGKDESETDKLVKFIATVGKPLLPYEETIAFVRLTGLGLGVQAIADRLGITVSLVEERLSMAQAIPTVVDKLKAGEITLASVQKIIDLAQDNGPKQAELLTAELENKGAVKEEVEQQREEKKIERIRLKRENLKKRKPDDTMTLSQARAHLAEIVDTYSDMIQARLPIGPNNRYWLKLQIQIVEVRNLKKKGALKV